MGIESIMTEVALQRYNMGRNCRLKGQSRKAKEIRSRIQEKQEQTLRILTQRVAVEHGEIHIDGYLRICKRQLGPHRGQITHICSL